MKNAKAVAQSVALMLAKASEHDGGAIDAVHVEHVALVIADLLDQDANV